MAREGYTRASNWYTPSFDRATRQLFKEFVDYAGSIPPRVNKPELARSVANGASNPRESKIVGLVHKVEYLEMYNLELHNRLLEVGKKVRELSEKHPELSAEISHLEAIIEGVSTAEPSHPQALPPYRKPY